MIKKQLFLTIFLAISMISCQKEESVVYPHGQSLPDSLRGLMLRVSQNPTSIDNMVDSTSCFRVQLPVSLIVNQQQVTILSEAGYGSVSYILNQSPTDDDSVTFIFPITIMQKNFEQVMVESQLELDGLISNCGPEDGLEEIECIDFNYPLTFNTYNSDFQLAEAITINNDQQLYSFLVNTMPEYLIELLYPVMLTNALGQSMIVDSNLAFENAIQGGIGSCVDDSN